MYLTLLNPFAQDSQVRLTYFIVGRARRPGLRRIVACRRNSRTTVAVHEDVQGVGRGKTLGVKVATTNGVNLVVERPMYFHYSPNGGPQRRAQRDRGKRLRAEGSWLFAEGYTGSGFDEYLIILNPNTTPAAGDNHLLPKRWRRARGKDARGVAPSSRASVPVHDAGQVGRDKEVSRQGRNGPP